MIISHTKEGKVTECNLYPKIIKEKPGAKDAAQLVVCLFRILNALYPQC